MRCALLHPSFSFADSYFCAIPAKLVFGVIRAELKQFILLTLLVLLGQSLIFFHRLSLVSPCLSRTLNTVSANLLGSLFLLLLLLLWFLILLILSWHFSFYNLQKMCH